MAALTEGVLLHVCVPLTALNSEPFVASIPGSKSLTNRALMIAAQRVGETVLRKALHCDDTDYLAACLDRFDGLSVEKTSDGYRVVRTRAKIGAPAGELFVGGAGTPARFLLSFAAMADGESVVCGNPRLSERPMGDLLRAFEGMGISYECLGKPDCLPIRVRGTEIAVPHWSVAGTTSSQFTSSLLLLAAQQPSGPITIDVTGKLVSRPYVEMTVRMLKDCGIRVKQTGAQTFEVAPGMPANDVIEIEADASGMSYFLAAAALTGTRVVIPNIGGGSAQGDLGFARVLRDMGCDVHFNDWSIELSGGELRGIDIDMEDMPDTVLTLSATAAKARGLTFISNVANLRIKECDRIHAAAAELKRLGIAAEEGPDWVRIAPNGAVRPATIETYDDHRVAMSFSLLGLLHPGIEIENPSCVAKSFPEFWGELDRFRSHHEAGRTKLQPSERKRAL
jgi:3-phosphoshikimate 1-carboxyvinyltransferase